MRALIVVAVSVWLAGCVSSSSTPCEGDRTCPAGTACAIYQDERLCVPAEAVTACDGVAEGAACQNGAGTCYGGACLPVGCGNGRIDEGETCDDGNAVTGDGCSVACASDETCNNNVTDPVRLLNGVPTPNEQCDDANATDHDGCSSACRLEAAAWRRLEGRPDQRIGTALATDPVRRRVVMFGGAVRDPRSLTYTAGDTWSLVADGWRRELVGVAPAPRSRHAMAFDGARVVLFGGTNGSTVFGDTWELDGAVWTERASAASGRPAPRLAHQLAYLPAVGAVLFGGAVPDAAGELLLGDTWVYGAGAWREITPTGARPPARADAAMTYDPVRQRLLLTGGRGVGGDLDDTWEFDGTSWLEISGAGAPRRASAMATYDAPRGAVVLFGGDRADVGDARVDEATTYLWSGTRWTSSPLNQLGHGGAAASDPLTGAALGYGLAIWSGPASVPRDVAVYVLGDTAWDLRNYQSYAPRRAAAAALDPDRKRVVLVGGTEAPSGGPTSTSSYELGEASWLVPPPFGPQRLDAAMVYARFGDEGAMYVFGGRNSGLIGDTQRFGPGAWTPLTPIAWTPLALTPAPPVRELPGMAFDVAHRSVVLFGGRGPSGVLGDTWTLTAARVGAEQWTDASPGGASPPARADHAMAYDPIRQCVVVFGGEGASGALADLWTWDGVAWTELHPPVSPGPRIGGRFAWDGARGALVLFGGDAADAWEWRGATWAPVPVVQPPALRLSSVLVPSPSGAGVIVAGGALPQPDGLPPRVTDEVLLLQRGAELGTETTCDARLDEDGDGKVGCDDPDCWASCTPWCPPGAPCDLSLPRCGDLVCDAPREDAGICPIDCGPPI